MATHEITTKWNGKMKFVADVNGFPITMDASDKAGGENSAPNPKPFVLVALSGCTGMDVIAMLRKAQKEPTYFDMTVSGSVSETHPKQYENIHVRYILKSEEDNADAIIRAVKLSQEQYCGVSAMLQQSLPVTWSIKLNEKEIFTNQQS